MLWLAWAIAHAAPVAAAADGPRRPMSFLGAGLFQWVNPKAWAIMLTGVSAYTSVGDPTPRLLVLAAVFAAVNLLSSMLWTGFGAGVRSLLEVPWKVQLFNWLMAALLLASLAPVVLELVVLSIAPSARMLPT
jgi:threonine/homoserine/homoserine lactone efflux protein